MQNKTSPFSPFGICHKSILGFGEKNHKNSYFGSKLFGNIIFIENATKFIIVLFSWFIDFAQVKYNIVYLNT